MSKGTIIAGTGTGVGKTLVTAALCHQLKATARAIKPVISGWNEEALAESDSGILLRAMNEQATGAACEEISPWRFTAPLSPDSAAAREGKRVTAREVSEFCRKEAAKHTGVLLAESAGGVMSPLNESETMLEWFAQLGWPVILVAGSYLGAFSHTFTAIRCLQARRLRLAALVVSQSQDAPMPIEETVQRIATFVVGVPVIALPRLPSGEPWLHAPDLTKWILPTKEQAYA